MAKRPQKINLCVLGMPQTMEAKSWCGKNIDEGGENEVFWSRLRLEDKVKKNGEYGLLPRTPTININCGEKTSKG